MTRARPGGPAPGTDAARPPSGRRRGPDLRLLGLLAGAWAAALTAVRQRPATAVLVGAAALALAGCLAAAALLVRRHAGPGAAHRPAAGLRVLAVLLRILLPVLLGAGSGALATAARTQVRYSAPLAGLVERSAHVRAELVVDADPTPVRHFAFGPPSWLVPATMERFVPLTGASAPVRLHGSVLVFGSGRRWADLLPGQRLRVTARLAAPERADLTAAVLSVRAPPRLVGDPPWYQRLAGRLRAGLRAACAGLPPAPGGLLPGLVDGDTSMLDPIVRQDFRTAGMTHLTAVSGSNLAIVLGFVLLMARWARAGPRLAAAAGMVATVGFVVLVRPEPSVLRAAVMGGLGLVALALHRPRAAVPGLALAGFVLLLVDPGLATRLGFALSVSATLGLLLLAPPWRDALRRHRVPRGVAEVLAVSLAAHLACAPLLAGYAGAVGVAAVPANVLAEPAVAPATVVGVGSALVSPVSPDAAHLLAWLAAWPCRWLVLVARTAAQAPAAVLPWPGGVSGGLLLAGVLLALLVCAGHRTARRILLVVLLAVALGAAPVRWATGRWPPDGWIMVACDVGQGDGLVLRVAPGQAVVVDTGPEPTAIDGCLRRLGVRSVPLLVLTHDDADHVDGIEGVFDGRAVGAVLVSRYRAVDSHGRDHVLRTAHRHGLTPFSAPDGWTYHAGALRLRVLATRHPLTGTESDSNNNCVVLRVRSAGVRLLLTGDAGPAEQAALRRAGLPLRADVLKVAHHGSRHQDPGFLSAVDPSVAVISVGADNDYGQPSSALVRRIRRAGIRLLRTDTDGDVTVLHTDHGLAVSRHTPVPPRSPP